MVAPGAGRWDHISSKKILALEKSAKTG